MPEPTPEQQEEREKQREALLYDVARRGSTPTSRSKAAKLIVAKGGKK